MQQSNTATPVVNDTTHVPTDLDVEKASQMSPEEEIAYLKAQLAQAQARQKTAKPVTPRPVQPASGPLFPKLRVNISKLNTRPDIPVWEAYKQLRKAEVPLDIVQYFYQEVFDVARAERVLRDWVTVEVPEPKS